MPHLLQAWISEVLHYSSGKPIKPIYQAIEAGKTKVMLKKKKLEQILQSIRKLQVKKKKKPHIKANALSSHGTLESHGG